MNMKRMRVRAFCCAAFWCIASACVPTETDDDGDSAGKVSALLADDTITFRLDGLQRPLRTLQVAVSLDGARARSVTVAADKPYDIVEAGLGEAPSAQFRLVVADTRRLLLTDGELARVSLDGTGNVTLGEAIAISDEGERVVLQTEVR